MRYRNSQGAAALSSASVDGAAFGTTFAHLFLMTFNNLVPDGLPQETKYVPRVFGFRVHPTSRQRISNGIAMGAATGGGAGNQMVGLPVSNRRIVSANANVVTANTTTVTSIAAEGANGVTFENVYAVSTAAAAPAAVGADGKVIKKGKRSKAKSEDSGGSSKRRTKGDNETNSSKRQKHP